MRMTSKQTVLASVTTITAFLVLAGCVNEPVSTLADGSSVHELITQQTNDPDASARNGTAAPVGTDPDVANAAVLGVRKASGQTNTATQDISTSIKQAIGSR